MDGGGAGVSECADVILEFLEAAVHVILYSREIYPKELFERKKLYGVEVWKSRHPDLNEYIYSHVESLKGWVERGAVEKVAVPILGRDHSVVERFVFEFKVDRTPEGARRPLRDLQDALRAFLLKITWVEGSLRKLPPDCTFEIVAYSLERDAGAIWVDEDRTDGRVEIPGAELIPIKSWAQGPVRMQAYAEAPRLHW